MKFFNRFRQKLLAENRFRKYLLYAIGEIFLVVIGILIALKINNANENAKTNAQLNGYLNSIRKNVQTDTVAINHIKFLRASQNEAAMEFMKLTFKDSVSLSVVERIAPILGEQYLIINPSGFDAIKNSGYIANLQGTEIEDAIYDYYNYYNQIHESEISLNNFIENLEAGIYASNYNDLKQVFKVLERHQYELTIAEEEITPAVEIIFKNSNILGIMERVASEQYFEVYDVLKQKGEYLTFLIENRIK
ncbi:hypothetical protein GCM10011414_07610 [Croceivirga lutea]|uniref:DUF6090 family protein n=1 Tax=Croceivirga lutea TaxID=1775167 RepID=UPI00163A75E1|nr:DUF6090 family protein [Croceivirga lutea]GGG40595.1 hypothetical protein GCM10011414_07610 [Croceivirga lutea]